MNPIFRSLSFLLAVPALAQFQTRVPATANDLINPQPGDPYFIFYSDVPSPLPNVVAGYSKVDRAGRRASIGHRFFYDRSAHIFFGYDIVVQPQDQIDTYTVSFYDLSMCPLDFPVDSADSLNPALWKRAPVPTPLPLQLVHAGESMPITVYRDPGTGKELLDSLTIAAMPPMGKPGHVQLNGIDFWEWAHSTPYNGNAAPPRKSYDIFGAARPFSTEDAEMRLQMGGLVVNGKPQFGTEGARVVTGELVWFYVPGHGRYILSLTPRPNLGFERAGEVRGGLVTFSIDDDHVVLESPAMVAPGEAPYFLYVLHDPSWAPTVQVRGGQLRLGSVSPKELAAIGKPASKY